MRNKFLFILGVIVLLATAAGCYFAATAIMDSLMEFRSPLADHPPQPGDALAEPLTRRVVLILVDALREDTSLDPQVMPYLQELRQQGAWATMHSRTPSYSAPGWATILTGAWPDINDSQPANPPDNDSVRPFTQDDIFTAAHRSGLKTALSGYAWFEGMLAHSGVDAGFYTLGEDHTADLEVLANAKIWLQQGDYQLVLIHLDQVDWAGHHEGGPRSQNWKDAAARVDSIIQEIISTLDLNQDTVIVLSDHGQIERGGHGGQDPVTMLEPFIMAGAGVVPGNYPDIQMVDIAPTMAVLLGTNLPASNQGQVLTGMLAIQPERLEFIQQALAGQQSRLASAYLAAIGQQTSAPSANSPIQAMQSARDQRLAQERIPRAVLALVLALIPAVILYLRRSNALLWQVGAALLYLVIFNATYALVVGKTYSLSSIYSADDLIFSTAFYAGISMLLAWLVIMLKRKAFSASPLAAASLSLSQTLLTLYLLAIPVLWNTFWNGFLVSWTLPEFSSMFIAFFSIVQGLFVALIGLILAGLSALIAMFLKKSNSRAVSITT